MLKDDILRELEQNRGKAISGQDMADKFKVSRNAVWKAINSLKNAGYNIESHRTLGYYIPNNSDVISEEGIRNFLPEELKNINIITYDSLDSTNNEAKRLLANDENVAPCLIISDGQTRGRGRGGKSFLSEKGKGIYMSLIFSKELSQDEADIITIYAAVAVKRVIERYIRDEVGLKWVNDIFYKNKKVAGILTEAISDLESKMISTVIIGIGINIKEFDVPDEYKDVIGFLNISDVPRIKISSEIVEELYKVFNENEIEMIKKEYFSRLIDPEKSRV